MKKRIVVLIAIFLILIIALIYFLCPVRIINGNPNNVRIIYAGTGFTPQDSPDYEGVDKDASAIAEAIQNSSARRTLSTSYLDTPDSRILLEYIDDTGHHTIWLYINNNTLRAESDKTNFVIKFSDSELLINLIDAVITRR